MSSTLSNFLIYDYEENYGNDILSCSHDRIVYSSRVYHILYFPHDQYQSENPCDIEGKNVDVLMVSFAGIDSKEILFDEVTNNPSLQHVSWEVYLSANYLPVKTKEAWEVDTDLLPASYEWTRRVYNSYETRFGKYSTFKGIYQAMETGMEGLTLQKGLTDAYAFQKDLTHSFFSTPKQFVISPYVDTNRDQVANTSIEIHANNFEILAKLSDVIAVQEGRGCGKNALYEPFQSDDVIGTIDPKLEEIVHYLETKKTVDPTFGETFFFPSRLMFEAFASKIEGLGSEAPEFWLNVEAFEYLRDDVCLPIDTLGNGMAELLDRTTKWRIDFSLTVESFYVNKITTFAWDYDYQCTTKEYSKSIYEEIQEDYRRPIVVQVTCMTSSSCTDIQVFGFNLEKSTMVDFSNGAVLEPYFVDFEFGKKNNKSRSMVELRVKNDGSIVEKDNPYPVYARNSGNVTSYHPRYFYVEESSSVIRRQK